MEYKGHGAPQAPNNKPYGELCPMRKRRLIDCLLALVVLLAIVPVIVCSITRFSDNSALMVASLMLIACSLILILLILFRIVVNGEDREYLEYDPATGLPRYRTFQKEVAKIIRSNPKGHYVISNTRLRLFRSFRLAYGTAEGDKVLKVIGDFLSKEKMPNLLALGFNNGDNFLALWDADNTEYEAVFQNLRVKLKENYPWYDFRPALGFCPISVNHLDVALCCENASIALNTINDPYNINWIVYEPKMNESILKEQRITSMMNKALSNGEFKAFIQPQFNYETGDMIGAEILVRWIRPDGSIISPADFVPVFEKNGFIYEMDKDIWEQACAFIRQMKDSGYNVPSVSVNVSRRDLHHESLVETLLGLLDKYSLEPRDLHLEVTESAHYENAKQLDQLLETLKERGFIIEMDDFGSGYSSLNALQGMPIDVLKLDARFLANDDWRRRGGKIITSVISMAHLIDLPVIAEGVETFEDAEFLKSVGCTFMQGYYFARPMALNEFEKLLAKQAKVQQLVTGDDTTTNGKIDFFDMQTQSTLVFNSFVGGAAIMSMDKDDRISALRVNDKFLEIMGIDRKTFSKYQYDICSGLTGKTAKILVETLKKAEKSGKEDSCLSCTIDLDGRGTNAWTYNRVRFLSRKTDMKLFYIAVENITDRIALREKNYELSHEMKEREELFMRAADQVNLFFWKYDIKTQTMYPCSRCMDKMGFPEVVENYPEPGIEMCVFPPEEAERYRAIMKLVEEGREDIDFVMNLTPSRTPFRIRYAIVRDEKGKPSFAYGTALPV